MLAGGSPKLKAGSSNLPGDVKKTAASADCGLFLVRQSFKKPPAMPVDPRCLSF